MNLRPRLHQPLLRPREAPAEAFERVEREDCGVFLVLRVKVGSMVRATGFDEHPNDDAEEPG